MNLLARRAKSAGWGVLVFALVAGVPVFAQDKAAVAAWKKDTDQAKTALEKNQFSKADDLFEAALVEAEKFGTNDSRLSETLNDLAFVREQLGERFGAEAALRRALAMDEQRLGTNDVDLLGELLGLGQLCAYAQRFEEADVYYSRAQSLAERKFGKFDRVAGVCIEARAYAALMENRLEDSEKLFKEALELIESNRIKVDLSANLRMRRWIARPDKTEIAETLNNMGLLYETEKKYGDAEAALNRSLSIYEEQYGKKSLNLCNGLFNLASVYFLEGKLAESEALLQRSLSILKATDPNLPIAMQTRDLLDHVRLAKSKAAPSASPQK